MHMDVGQGFAEVPAGVDTTPASGGRSSCEGPRRSADRSDRSPTAGALPDPRLRDSAGPLLVGRAQVRRVRRRETRDGGLAFDSPSGSSYRPDDVANRRTELLKGTLDLLILKTLALEPRHGVGIADRIAQITNGTFQVKAGSLFPALHRLEQDGFIAGEWGTTPEGYRAKFYQLTRAGQRQLTEEQRQWARIVLAMGRVLEAE